RHEILRHGEEIRDRGRQPCRRPMPAIARRLRLSGGLRDREDRARPAGPPDPRRHQRDHAPHHRARDAGREGLMDPELLIRTERRAGRLTLNRPKALNALTHAICLETTAALERWRDDPAVALDILDDAGVRYFCTGGVH